MADITGARGTGNITQGLRKVDMSEKIMLLDPSAMPLTIFSKRASKKPTHNPEFKWATDELESRFDQVNGAVASTSTTTVTVDNGTKFAEHDLCLFTGTNEMFRVQAVAGNVLTIVRGVGSTAVNIPDDQEIMILSSAQPEGDTSKPARSENADLVTNYCQILRDPVEITETARHSDLFVDEDDWTYQKSKKGIEHATKIERALLFGGASEDTSGSQPRRSTKGIARAITTNVTAVGGTLSETAFFTTQRAGFRYGSKRKLGLAGGLVVDVLNAYARGKVEVVDQDRTVYGVAVTDYRSPHGTTHLVRHDLMEGTKWGGALIGVDLDNAKYRYLANSNGSRDTHLKDNIQAPDADTQKAEYISECGLQWGEERTHYIATGITS